MSKSPNTPQSWQSVLNESVRILSEQVTSLANRGWKAPAPPAGMNPSAQKVTELAFRVVDTQADNVIESDTLGTVGYAMGGRAGVRDDLQRTFASASKNASKAAALHKELIKIGTSLGKGQEVKDTLPVQQLRTEVGIDNAYWNLLMTSCWKGQMEGSAKLGKYAPVPTLKQEAAPAGAALPLRTGFSQMPDKPLMDAEMSRVAKAVYDTFNVARSEAYGDYVNDGRGQSEKIVRPTYAKLPIHQKKRLQEFVKALYGAGVIAARDMLLTILMSGKIHTHKDRLLAVKSIVSAINTQLKAPDIFGTLKVTQSQAIQPLSNSDKRAAKPFEDTDTRIWKANRDKEIEWYNKQAAGDNHYY